MAAVTVYVNTDNVGTEDGTTHATGWATLADAIADMNAGTFNSDDVTIECSGATNDTTAVSVSISDTPLSITIKGDRSAGNGFNNGAPLIDTAFYLLAPGNVGSVLNMAEPTIDVTIDGLQIESGHTGSFGYVLTPQPQEGYVHTIKNCRILNTSSCDVGIGRDGQAVTLDGVLNIENNIIVGFQDANIWLTNGNYRDVDLSIVHNTVYGGGSGYGIRVTDSVSGDVPATWTVRGNAIANCTTDISLEGLRAQTTVVQNDNATDDSGRDAADFDIGTLTDAWTSPGTTAAADFTVKDTGSNLYNAVSPAASPSGEDIIGTTRGAAPNSAGAFALAAAGALYYETISAIANGGIVLSDVLTYTRTISPTATAAPSLSKVPSLHRTIAALCTVAPSVTLGVSTVRSAVATALTSLRKKVIKGFSMGASGSTSVTSASSYKRSVSASSLASIVIDGVRTFPQTISATATIVAGVIASYLGNLIPALWRDGVRPLFRGLIRRMTGNIDPPFGGEY